LFHFVSNSKYLTLFSFKGSFGQLTYNTMYLFSCQHLFQNNFQLTY
jgi:hypothetical protein